MASVDSSGKRHKYILTFAFIAVLTCNSLFAQGSGTIKGQVRDKESGSPLPGANVLILGTSLGSSTDLDGEFYLYNVPAGNITLRISYIGYATITQNVTVVEGEQTKAELRLTPQALEGETVVITAQVQGQMQAINQQLTSNKIVNVVSESKIQELPDFNAAEAIGRLPGISTLRSSGEANKIIVRGIAPQYNLVAIEGINLSATGNGGGIQINPGQPNNPSQDRSTDVTMITPNMLKSIEVYKTLTPDMEANAIGGYVNMQLREAPSDLHTDLRWQSGYVRKTSKYGNYKALASASDRFFNDVLGVYLLGSAEEYDRGDDRFNAGYARRNQSYLNMYSPIYVQSIGLDRHFETRSRYGANLILDYRLPGGSVKLINMFSRLSSKPIDYTTRFDLVNKSLDLNLSNGDGNTDVMINAVQAEYDFGFISADVSAANSYSRNFVPHQRTYTFTQPSITDENGNAITVPDNALPEQIVPRIKYVDSLTYLQYIGNGRYEYKENGQIYTANFKIPFNLESSVSGFLKFGGKLKQTKRTNDQDLPYGWLFFGGSESFANSISSQFPTLPRTKEAINGIRRFYASGFKNPDQNIARNFLGNKFGDLLWVPTSITLDAVMSYVESVPSLTDPKGGAWVSGPYQNLINDYTFIENYYAGYTMAELDLGADVTVVGGVRYEEVASDFTAYRIKDSGNPRDQPSKKVTANPGNRYWLPMVQAKYKIAEWADMRYSYTKTIARPDFTANSPYQNANVQGQYINTGDPNLVPAESYNHDFMFTLHDNYIGLFSVGAFDKTIYNFVYFTQYILVADSLLLPGFYRPISDFADVSGRSGSFISTWVNNPYKATIRGIEGEWQTRFWYLPFPLDGIVLAINYTHIWSDTKYPFVDRKNLPGRPPIPVNVDTLRSGRLLNQPADIVSASVGYDYEGFSGRVSFLYQADMVNGISNIPEGDGFTKPYFRTDLSIRQKLPLTGLQLFLNVNNINEREDVATQASIGGTTSQNFYGLTADAGLRFTF